MLFGDDYDVFYDECVLCGNPVECDSGHVSTLCPDCAADMIPYDARAYDGAWESNGNS